jgi:phosphinothricin acetyltransferase
MEFRDANIDDAAQIVSIYNHYVLNTVISMEYETVTPADMAQRIGDVQSAGLPWLVLLDGERIVGYAYASKWRARFGYRHSVESSVYLAPEQQRRGLGGMLYRRLLERLREQGCHAVMGGIALPNPGSVALHEKLGFDQVAHFREVGRKFGGWVDVGYWQLTLGHSE